MSSVATIGGKWLFGFVAKTVIGKVFVETKGMRIWKAINQWAKEDLPHAHLQAPVSLFPEEASDDFKDRPILASVYQGFLRNECPGEEVWVGLLIEQKQWVSQKLGEDAAEFFLLSDDETRPLFEKLARRIVQALAQDDAVSKELIRDTNAKVDDLLEKFSILVDHSSSSASNVESFTHSAKNEEWHESEIAGAQTNKPLAEQIATPEPSLQELKAHSAKQQEKITESVGLLTEARVESINQLLLEKEFGAATNEAVEFQEWLATQIDDLNQETLVRCYAILGRVAIVNQSAIGVGNDKLRTASEYLSLANESLDDECKDSKREVAGLRIKVLAEDENWDAIQALTDELDDPKAKNTQLLLFMDLNEQKKAADYLTEIGLDSAWCDTATRVYGAVGDFENSRKALTYAIENAAPAIVDNSRIAFCHGVFDWGNSELNDGSFNALTLIDRETELLEECVEVLTPIVSSTNQQNIAQRVRETAVSMAAISNRLLKRWSDYHELIDLLAVADPPSIEFAKVCYRGERKPDPEFSNRLRNSFPRLLEPNILAFQIDFRYQQDDQLIRKGIALFELANSEKDNERIASELYQSFSWENTEIRSVISEKLGSNHTINRLFEIAAKLMRNDISITLADIESLPERNHIVKIQLKAIFFELHNEFDKAIEEFEKVGNLISEPIYLKEAARVAFNAGMPEVVIRNLKAALLVDSRDIQSLHNLATVYTKLDDYDRAAEYYKQLIEINPQHLGYRCFYAESLALALNLPDAIREIRQTYEDNPYEIRPALLLARFLADNQEPAEAVQVLQRGMESFSDSIEFQATIMSLAYEAGDDRVAAEAMKNILRLQSNDDQPAILEGKSIEEFVEFADHSREHRRFVQEQVIEGKSPWIFAEKMAGNVPIWGWTIRTQAMSWISDSPHEASAFSIYATNGFACLPGDEGRKSLVPPRAPKRGTEIVADLSFLITTFQLGLHRYLEDVFTKVYLPSSYKAGVLQELGQLRPIQKSRLETAKKIDSLIEIGSIEISGRDDCSALTLDAYSASHRENKISWNQFLRLLQSNGVSSKKQNEFETIFLPEWGAVVEDNLAIPDGINVVVESLTLDSIVGLDLFEELSSVFKHVRVRPQVQNEVKRAVGHFDLLDDVRRQQESLWRFVQENSSIFETSTVFSERQPSKESGEPRLNILDSMNLADQVELPLAVDDRVIQNGVINKKQERDAAFTTFDYILMLNESDVIDDVQGAQYMLKLIEWRYRFFVIPAKYLKTIYKEYKQDKLEKIARYIQDCIRDPGLFAGPEPTEPPMPMAGRFASSWLREITKFVVDLWLEENADLKALEAFTLWCFSELIPSVPRKLATSSATMPDFINTIVITNALFGLNNTDDSAIANKALETIREGLGMSREDLIETGSKVINFG